jgi:4-hydroxybenzoate polyprenyltransferase
VRTLPRTAQSNAEDEADIAVRNHSSPRISFREGRERREAQRTGRSRREGQTYSSGSLLARYASFVKLPHTLFALPFAGLGVVFASYFHTVTWWLAVWIVVAFTAARFAAMGFNRIVDRRYDALNPRTAQRELPAGRLTLPQAVSAVIFASLLFIIAAMQLNPLVAMLAPIALAWVFFYSFTKRFTAWSHHVLGFALAMAPVGAYLAVAGEWATPWYGLLVLAGGVTLWVAGFDIIYAVQDTEFDREQGLHSMPARLGGAGALERARLFHVLAVALFFSIWGFQLFPVGPFYGAGVGVMALLLVYEHRVARSLRGGTVDMMRVDRAFFYANVAVSITLFTLALVDRLLLGVSQPGV